MPDTTNDIDALQAQLMKAREDEGWFITGDQAKDFSRALTDLVAERDALQVKVNAHAEDRRQYIEAWAHWIEFKSALGIEEWLRAYADAVPAPPLDGDEAKKRIWDHLDQRMRDAADMIAALEQRVAEQSINKAWEQEAASDIDRLRSELAAAIKERDEAHWLIRKWWMLLEIVDDGEIIYAKAAQGQRLMDDADKRAFLAATRKEGGGA